MEKYHYAGHMDETDWHFIIKLDMEMADEESDGY